MHNVTLALELLKNEGLLDYPVSPEGECSARVGLWPRSLGSQPAAGCTDWGVFLLLGVGA